MNNTTHRAISKLTGLVLAFGNSVKECVRICESDHIPRSNYRVEKYSAMMTQLQHYELARRKLADANSTFMELVNHPTNPLTREDLAANIERRPALWERYAGFLDTLPSGKGTTK